MSSSFRLRRHTKSVMSLENPAQAHFVAKRSINKVPILSPSCLGANLLFFCLAGQHVLKKAHENIVHARERATACSFAQRQAMRLFIISPSVRARSKFVDAPFAIPCCQSGWSVCCKLSQIAVDNAQSNPENIRCILLYIHLPPCAADRSNVANNTMFMIKQPIYEVLEQDISGASGTQMPGYP